MLGFIGLGYVGLPVAMQAVARMRDSNPLKARRDGIAARRAHKGIAKVAAARQLITYVYWAMRDGEVRRLNPAAGS